MRSLTKGPPPEGLVKNGTRWRDELLSQIEERGTDDVPKQHWRRYNRDDVKEALKRDSHRKCVYCEEILGSSSWLQVEHIRPMKRWPEYGFDWANLAPSCEVCNRSKSDKWCDEHPVLNAFEDPIENHIAMCGPFTIARGGSARGRTTVDHADLLRPDLFVVRMEDIAARLGPILTIAEASGWDDPRVHGLVDQITAPGARFSTMYAEAVEFIKNNR